MQANAHDHHAGAPVFGRTRGVPSTAAVASHGGDADE